MGTSASSRGPGPGVPIVPPWVQDPATPPGTPLPTDPPIAPPGRFRPARTALGRFGGSGRQEDLRRGLGHYVRSGMGGAGNATARMGSTAARAGALYGALQDLAAGEALAEYGLDEAQLQGLTQAEIIDRLVDALCPADGTQEAEASRDSAARALAECVGDDDDVRDLPQERIDQVVRDFLGNEIANQVALDVGLAVLQKAPNAKTGQQRLEEMQDYVRQELGRRYDERRALNGRLDRESAARLGREVMADAFDVFESYVS